MAHVTIQKGIFNHCILRMLSKQGKQGTMLSRCPVQSSHLTWTRSELVYQNFHVALPHFLPYNVCNPFGKNHHRGNFPQSSESKVNKKLLVSTTVLFGNHLQQPGSSSGLTKLPFSLAKSRLPYHPSWPKTRRPSALVQRPQTFATGRPGRPGLAHHGLNKRMWIERHPCNDTQKGILLEALLLLLP